MSKCPNPKDHEAMEHIRNYLSIMATEPSGLLKPLDNLYHELRREIGDE